MDIFDLLFPKKCLTCSRAGRYLCWSCLAKLPLERQACPYCKGLSLNGKTHKRCLSKLGLDGHYYLWEYRGVVRKAILTMKYKFAFDIARDLVDLASNKLKKNPILGKKIILLPVPSHPLRKNWRGFNQSEAVGKPLAEAMGWEYKPNLLVKVRPTMAQTELKRGARLSNLQNAFSLNGGIAPGKRIVLFDDIWTTGSTLKEACRELKKAGVKKVWGLTLAKTY